MVFSCTVESMFDSTQIIQLFVRFLILLPCIVLHEMAHGYAALKMGDETAKRAGRLTLNPIAHIDPFGTIILPLLMLVASGGTFAFGAAKPVPINPWNFRDERKGLLITGIAGPAVNIAIAVIAGVLLRILLVFSPLYSSAVTPVVSAVAYVLFSLCYLNLVMTFFNLIPIPPLDGSRVLQRFLPDRARDAYHMLERFGFVIIIAIAWLAPVVLDTYFSITVTPLLRLLIGFS